MMYSNGRNEDGMSNKKLAGIIVACAIAMTVIIVMITRTPMYTVSISVSPSGAGSVSPSGGEYESGTQITLTATPASGYTFDYWTGDMFETSPTAVITIISDMYITAQFAKTYTLTTNVSSLGAGSVSPSAGQYKSGSQVILTVAAANGYKFDHWGVSLSDTSSTKIVIMDSDREITAHFIKTYALTTNVSPSGAGSVSPSSGEYESGSQITLEARPASDYTFDYWGGDASGHVSTITIELDSDKDIIAHFAPATFKSITFTGSSDRTTPPFTTTTSEWVIDWSYIPDYEYPEYATFGFLVYPRGETVDFVKSVLFPESTSGSTYSYAGPGEYYIEVLCANIKSWKITIKPP
jgi:hypothetical protein